MQGEITTPKRRVNRDFSELTEIPGLILCRFPHCVAEFGLGLAFLRTLEPGYGK